MDDEIVTTTSMGEVGSYYAREMMHSKFLVELDVETTFCMLWWMWINVDSTFVAYHTNH